MQNNRTGKQVNIELKNPLQKGLASFNIHVKKPSLTEFYNADEVFTCGIMGELTPLYEIDGRTIENKSYSSAIKSLEVGFHNIISTYCEKLPKFAK